MELDCSDGYREKGTERTGTAANIRTDETCLPPIVTGRSSVQGNRSESIPPAESKVKSSRYFQSGRSGNASGTRMKLSERLHLDLLAQVGLVGWSRTLVRALAPAGESLNYLSHDRFGVHVGTSLFTYKNSFAVQPSSTSPNISLHLLVFEVDIEVDISAMALNRKYAALPDLVSSSSILRLTSHPTAGP